ncbi:cation diffusion facilitator family transporter [Microbulbifer magnicolonia]|uniref:cation diffusion facilitator family transporter n=1 Tax=Microbulbifer magnicolonia TaxID=3109744 RepID=UPI002B410417|nr:cation diffusion facilitator family transporter [Microbulbifer sp. GG15]
MHRNNHTLNEDASSRRIGLAFFLNLGFTIIEFVGGLLTNSTAIMADAVHDLGDSVSIGSAWLLNRWGGKTADSSFTYGYRRLSLFGALFNGLVLLIGSVWVLSKAIPRLANPEMPVTEGMMALAVFGVGVNGYAAYRLSHGTSLNERVLNWHLLEDVLGWLAVLIVALVLHFVELPILDPLLSIGFTLFILSNVIKNLWVTAKLFFQGVPDKEMWDEINKVLLEVPGVSDVHHLHLWSLDGEHHVLTVHIVLDGNSIDIARHQKLKGEMADKLEKYQLQHTTIEFELSEELCRDQIDK